MPYFPQLTQNSRRALALLKEEASDGYVLMNALGLKDAKELRATLEPLVTTELVKFAGSPYTEDGVAAAQYYILPSMSGTVAFLLATQPARLSERAPAGKALSQDSRVVLAAVDKKVSFGYELMAKLGAGIDDTDRLADALSPLVESGLVQYSGKPFTPNGVFNAVYAVPPSMGGQAKFLLATQPPKFGGQAA